jgi:hypothetical protein
MSINFRLSNSNYFAYFLIGISFFAYMSFNIKFIYAIPIFYLVTAIIMFNEYNVVKRNIFGLLLYIVIVLLSSIVSADNIGQKFFTRDLIIISSSFVLFLFPLNISEKHLHFIFTILFLSYLIYLWQNGFKFIFSEIQTSFNPLNAIMPERSDSEWDNGYAFGSFLIFYIFRRKKLLSILCFIIVVLISKRLLFLALGSSFVTYLLFFRDERLSPKSTKVKIILFCYVLFFYLFAVHLQGIAQYFISIFQMNIDITGLLQGRDYVINFLLKQLQNDNLLIKLFGHGAGSADAFVGSTGFFSTNPHNDFLKLQFDYGYIGLIFFIIILYLFYVKNKIGIFIFLFVIPLFTSENTLIYLGFIIPSAMICHFNESPPRLKTTNYV